MRELWSSNAWLTEARDVQDRLRRTLRNTRDTTLLEDVTPGAKIGGKIAMTGAGIPGTVHTAVGALGFVGAHGSALAAAGGAAAAVGGALPPVGIALSAFNAALQGRAAWSTHNHVVSLEKLEQMTNSHDSWRQWHTTQRTRDILAYAISQKGRKLKRRVVAAVPGVSLFGSLYTLGRFATKKNKGVARTENAERLVVAFVRESDWLAGAILNELTEEKALLGAASLGTAALIGLAKAKLAST